MYDNQRWEPDYTRCWLWNNPSIPCSGAPRWLGVHQALGHSLVPACDAHTDGMTDLEPYDGTNHATRPPTV
jgi:hypothetical protein